jgi:hypothetical protein
MGVMTRRLFNEQFHFQDVAEEKARCCRNCEDFRRHLIIGTFCHYLSGVSMNRSESRVWGKSGCDRFSPAGGEG